MAAWVNMRTPRAALIARTMLIWTALAVVVATVASCTHIVSGRAVLSGPRIGQPVEWGPCRVTGGGGTSLIKLPGGALCGKLAVPVDYKHPDGDATTLALIKFPATRAKIGSLVINPGGPGESGIEAALSLLQSVSSRVRERFDLVGFDPRGVAGSRPAIWCNSDADNDRLRKETQADYSPAGVVHIEDQTKEYVARCVANEMACAYHDDPIAPLNVDPVHIDHAIPEQSCCGLARLVRTVEYESRQWREVHVGVP